MQSDDNSSSLGDSAYEILTESTILTSDDEDRDDNTDSVASLDEHGIDDVASLADTEASEETTSSSSHSDFPLGAQGIPEFTGLDRNTRISEVSDSGVTTKGEERLATLPIEFEEPAFFGEQVSVTHTVCNFNEQQTSEILAHFRLQDPPARIAATVRQTMTKQGLEIDEPFRVLYIGSPTAKGEIISKIAASLAVPGAEGSRQRSSRFNVVPISSFGDNSAPEVELIDSFGIELVVDECSHAETAKADGSPDTLTLNLNDSFWYRSRCDDSGFHLESSSYWKLPHVAIFFCSDNDSISVRQTRLYARSFMARHKVPSIVISQNPHYGRQVETYALDTRSVHMCLESRSATLLGNKVLKRLPIDLSTFLNIDARQMNRNLAYLTGLYTGRGIPQPPSREQIPSQKLTALGSEDIEKMSLYPYGLGRSVNFLRERRGKDFWTASLALGLLALILATTTFTLKTGGFGQSSWRAKHSGPENYIEVVSSTATSVVAVANTASSIPPVQTHNSATLASTETDAPVSNGVTNPSLDFASLLFDPSLTGFNDSDQFKLHIIGDCHMILRPPRRFNLLKKPPKIFVRLTRNDKIVDVSLSKLFEGAFTLKLEREDAYGTMNVSVWTESKPVMEQSFDLDFGTPWLKVWSWRKAAQALSEKLQKDVKYAQDSLQTAIGQVAVDVRRVVGKASQDAREKSAGAQELVVTTAKQLSEKASEQSKMASKELALKVNELSNSVSQFWKCLPSLRDPEHVRRAQLQAQRLWRKHSDKKESRTAARMLRRASKLEKRTCRKDCKGHR